MGHSLSKNIKSIPFIRSKLFNFIVTKLASKILAILTMVVPKLCYIFSILEVNLYLKYYTKRKF